MKKSFGSLVFVALAMWSGLSVSPGYSQRYLGSAPTMEMGMPGMVAPMAAAPAAGGVPGMLPTDRSGAPIYANQERYYGLNDCKGDCDDRAMGPAFGRMPTYGPVLPAGMACGNPCGSGCCGWGFPLFQGFRKIWNGRNYWEGVGCSERVIDELKKSWQTCRKCDLVGQNLNGMGNTIGTGLQSGKILGSSMNQTYAPIPMNAGYAPNLPQGTPPTYFRSGNGGGGCSSCGKGITVTANSPQNTMPQNMYPGQNVPMVASPNVPQAYPAVQVQYIQTPQGVQAVPVQQTVPVQPVSQGVYYRANYPAEESVPGYIKAQRKAQAMQSGIGLDEKKPTRSAYSGRTATEAKQEVTGEWISVNEPSPKVEKTVYYQPTSTSTVIQPVTTAEVIPTPPARVISPAPSGNVVETAPPAVVYAETPPMAYAAPPATGVIPCDTGCAPVCGPMAGPLCGPVCGPMGCGAPGIVPGAVRLTGRVAYGAGQVVAGAGRVVAFGTESAVYGTGAVVVGAGKVAVGATRAVLMAGRAVLRNVRNAGIVFVSGPCGPIGCAPGTPVPPCYSPYLTGVPYAGVGAASPVPVSGETDPLYMENESYLQMDLSQYRPNTTASVGVGQNMATVAQVATPTSTIGLLSTQTQRVVMADGTEVILEHAANPQNVASVATTTPISPVSQFSGTPAPATPVSGENYPIVAVENPQIELAPGEVLVSQQDFILAPPENAPATSRERPTPVAEPTMENKTVQHTSQPFRTVSYAKPAVSSGNITPVSAPVTYQRPAEPSFLKLKAATPIDRR
ncbi:MAG: hypothetical protein Q4D62_15545 [Planctomycetia bacterium]|nr:hypothetical protein [Planctomycetia bacterium]